MRGRGRAQVSYAVLFVPASPNRGCPMSRDFRDMGTTTVSTWFYAVNILIWSF